MRAKSFEPDYISNENMIEGTENRFEKSTSVTFQLLVGKPACRLNYSLIHQPVVIGKKFELIQGGHGLITHST